MKVFIHYSTINTISLKLQLLPGGGEAKLLVWTIASHGLPVGKHFHFALFIFFIYFHFGLMLKQPLETKLWEQLKANGGDSHHIISCDISVQQITVQY